MPRCTGHVAPAELLVGVVFYTRGVARGDGECAVRPTQPMAKIFLVYRAAVEGGSGMILKHLVGAVLFRMVAIDENVAARSRPKFALSILAGAVDHRMSRVLHRLAVHIKASRLAHIQHRAPRPRHQVLAMAGRHAPAARFGAGGGRMENAGDHSLLMSNSHGNAPHKNQRDGYMTIDRPGCVSEHHE